MKTFILKNKKLILGLISMLLCVCVLMGFVPSSFNASADTPTITAQGIIDNTTFVGFNKAENEEKGKMLFANYFINDGYWDPTNYTYGCVIIPVEYVDKYGFNKDFHASAAAQGVTILSATSDSCYDVTAGSFFRIGLTSMSESTQVRTMLYVFYIQDKTTQEYTYGIESSAVYSTLTNDSQNIDLSDYVSKEMYDLKVSLMRQQIDGLEEEIEQLEKSLTEEGVDMSKFITIAEHEAKVAALENKIAELQLKINQLQANNSGNVNDEKPNQPTQTTDEDKGLSTQQIIGIGVGAVLFIALIVVIASLAKKKDNEY